MLWRARRCYDEIPLRNFFGTGVVARHPEEKWDVITADDLEKASQTTPVREGDIVIVNTGWHNKYADSAEYYAYSPGYYKEAGEWFVSKKVKAVGADTQALDHPLGTAIGPHGPAEESGVYCRGPAASTRSSPATRSSRTSRTGSPATTRSCLPASTDSRTSAVTWTRSPANASPSPRSRGAGSAATGASSAWSPSPTLSGSYRIETGQ